MPLDRARDVLDSSLRRTNAVIAESVDVRPTPRARTFGLRASTPRDQGVQITDTPFERFDNEPHKPGTLRYQTW